MSTVQPTGGQVLAELEGCGVGRDSVRLFEGPITPDHQDYLDLVGPREPEALLPDGVAEAQGKPILFFLNGSKLAGFASGRREPQLADLRRKLACRGDRSYLAVVRPGEVSVVPVDFTDRQPEWKPYTPGSSQGQTLFSRLVHGLDGGASPSAKADVVFGELFKLLDHSTGRLATRAELRPDVLSLVGRALFFRFLRDRNVINEEAIRSIAPRAASCDECFASPENSAATCEWLDRTFNGDFLPLSGDGETFFRRIEEMTGGGVFRHLTAVVRGDEPAGDEAYQLKFDWGDFDFAHTPVGLLSQVYEAFCWKWEKGSARTTSVHYTPRNIASTLIDEAFDGLPGAAGARVLDPSCGAGIFLVLAFRRLYQETWRSTGRRPGTEAIRQILVRQLTGFDISDSALRLAALSLYLTAIELDPEPVPPEKLRFENLRGRVLFNFRRQGIDPEAGPVTGSLGRHAGPEFDGRYDLVVGNPPWTSVSRALGAELDAISKVAIEKIDVLAAQQYRNPDRNPDLPFLWRATGWCAPGGRIAMALPARILLKQAKTPTRARRTLFQLLEVTGIISGANLADTKVWPNMSQPFMLLFARNRRPPRGHHLNFITLHYDQPLNRRGELRIDSKSVIAVDPVAAEGEPWLWKALSVGTMLDVAVVEKIKAASEESLKKYWRRVAGRYRHGKGYIRGEPEKRTRDASHLDGRPNLNSTEAFRFAVEPDQLPTFDYTKVQWPRRDSIYDPPLALIKESPGVNRREGRGLLCLERIAYNESFSGYSAAGHPNAEMLVRYLHLFIHSDVWLYYILMTSPQFGSERRRFHKADLEECPLVPLDRLNPDQVREVGALSQRLTREEEGVFEDIDRFFASLYGLDRLDQQVVRDTIAVGLPYNRARNEACRPPTDSEQRQFAARVESLLQPFFGAVGREAGVAVWNPSGIDRRSATFGTLLVTRRGDHLDLSDELYSREVLSLADETGATRIVSEEIAGALLVGILNQYRYWTPTRARLLAADLLRGQLDAVTEDPWPHESTSTASPAR